MASKNQEGGTGKGSAMSTGGSPQTLGRGLDEQAQICGWLRQALLFAKTLACIALLALYGTVSQLNLAPVFGSLPSSTWHASLLAAGFFAGWAGNVHLRSTLRVDATQALPLVAFYTPLIQFFLCGKSEFLGPQWGPWLVEALTLLPLAALTAASTSHHSERARLDTLPAFVAEAAPCLTSWALFKLMETAAKQLLQGLVGRAVAFTRLGLQCLFSVSYSALAPSKYLAFALPAMLHTALCNTHMPRQAFQVQTARGLLADGWTLLERHESVTGYISVVESLKQGFRVMRCDHSLLGGKWTRHGGGEVAEPIYAIFVMLEAVRLVERTQPLADKDAQALVIGLGAGTTPSALVSHGINTSVVEIDPVIHALAIKYFDYRQNNPPVLRDAVGYMSELVNRANSQTFDYIVHDVFTGGAEPVELFTLEFLQTLHALLRPEGVIAINYAGDLGLPSAGVIVRTIHEVFPTCRIFRDEPANRTAVDEGVADFANMAIFCTKTSLSPLRFRRPVAQDFLRSGARHAFLEPRHEMPLSTFLANDEPGLLRRSDMGKMAKWQEISAMGHWKIIRTVVPAKVWEMW